MPKKKRVLFGKGHICYKEENFQVGLRQDCEQASVGAARGNTVLAQACEHYRQAVENKCLTQTFVALLPNEYK